MDSSGNGTIESIAQDEAWMRSDPPSAGGRGGQTSTEEQTADHERVSCNEAEACNVTCEEPTRTVNAAPSWRADAFSTVLWLARDVFSPQVAAVLALGVVDRESDTANLGNCFWVTRWLCMAQNTQQKIKQNHLAREWLLAA